jgi:manganese-dependent inorganic pyrophosphatase
LFLCRYRFSSSMCDKEREIFVIGHRNPDTDAITAALVYAQYLRHFHLKATAYRLGELNNETKFVLQKAQVEQPDLLPNDLPEGSQIALVDHNESTSWTSLCVLHSSPPILGQQSMDNLNKMRVTHVVDHHKIGDLTTADPVFLRFEPVGCTGTILTKLFREQNVDIDQKAAFLMMSAILSDTLHFR